MLRSDSTCLVNEVIGQLSGNPTFIELTRVDKIEDSSEIDGGEPV